MGRGRKPKATELHKRDGTYRPGEHGGRAHIDPGVPSPPSGLCDAAKAEWKRLVGILSGAKLLTLADRSELALHCQSLADYWRLRERVTSENWLGEGAQGQTVAHPLLNQMNKCWEQAEKSARELGLTIASRASIKVEQPAVKVDTTEAELFGVVG